MGTDRDHDEDRGLIDRCRKGEALAFRDLVARHQRSVYSALLRIVRRSEDAEDLTQETFIRVHRALDRYDPERPFTAWLYTIATRLAIDHLRRRRVPTVSLTWSDPDSSESYELDVADPGPGPDTIVSHREEERRSRDLIASLPEHYRVVVVLRHQFEQSYEEIAEALGLPLGTVKARVHRARALLKDRLQSGGASEH